MRWPNLVGRLRPQPPQGRWHDWKQDIANHCRGQCVYCGISEARFGGIRNFHIEHFRPKIKFPKLENTIANLYLACSICNVLKSDDWPAEPATDHSLAAYPDPFLANYNEVFTVSSSNYEVDSPTVAGKYVIERVLLNRAQLVLERRLASAFRLINYFERWATKSIDSMTAEEAKATVTILAAITNVQMQVFQARPYRDIDTKRPATTKGRKQRSRS